MGNRAINIISETYEVQTVSERGSHVCLKLDNFMKLLLSLWTVDVKILCLPSLYVCVRAWAVEVRSWRGWEENGPVTRPSWAASTPPSWPPRGRRTCRVRQSSRHGTTGIRGSWNSHMPARFPPLVVESILTLKTCPFLNLCKHFSTVYVSRLS